VYAPAAPISETVAATVVNHGGRMVNIPTLIGSQAPDDLENLLLRAVRECRAVGGTLVESMSDAAVHSVSAGHMAAFLRLPITYRLSIVGHSNLSIRDAVKMAVSAADTAPCNITFRTFPHAITTDAQTRTTIREATSDVRAMIRSSFTNFSIVPETSPYFSIVVVGRYGNFSKGFELPAQNSLWAIQQHLAAVPLADVEIVFVDYATQSNRSLLHEVLDVGRLPIRFVIVPESAHRRLVSRMNGSISFLKYVAKNIGIRRARGCFVLTTTRMTYCHYICSN
jgi:hypothetical protein